MTEKQKTTEIAELNDTPTSMLAVIERAAMNPDVDVAKMQALLEMQERVMVKQAELQFNTAKSQLMEVLPTVTKQGKIEFTDKDGNFRSTPFARYEDIDRVIRPFLIQYGFSVSFDSEPVEGGSLMSGTLSHSGGHSKTSSIRLPLDTSGSKNNLQAMGSTISYGKRYLVGMLLNIITVGEDNDGATFGECIDIEKAAEIDTLIRESGADLEKFLSYMAVESIQDILTKDYKKAINSLNAKKKKEA